MFDSIERSENYIKINVSDDCKEVLKDLIMVIRCKDCEYWTNIQSSNPNWHVCEMWGYNKYSPSDGFCFFGKRKD